MNYIHGGDIYSDGVLIGRELLDFSSNINPLGIPDSFTIHLAEAINSLTRYPDIQYRELINSLCTYEMLGTVLHKENFILGNGASEIIDLSISCFKKVLIVVPSFLEYELSAKKWGVSIEYSYLDSSLEIDYQDIYNRMQNCDALIIGNPNNPNGGIIDKDKFQPILGYCENAKKTIIIDEAFIEFTNNIKHSFSGDIREYNCILIIRALTKYFAMPGIRFGYGITSNTELAEKIKSKQNPWNINCFAETAAKYVVKDKNYMDKSREWIENERNYMNAGLKEISFIEKVYKSYSNFLLCKLEGIDCHKLYDLCFQEGVLIRKAYNFQGLDEDYVRFAIKDREKNEKFMNILREVQATI
ncbi:MAG: histidinol-phosphate transaminase [Bacillota bacterium]|nr:histidinol-phosphate transaminase [Bacillota bacterium]